LKQKKYKAVVILFFVLFSIQAKAGIILPKIIGDNMVLQRNQPDVIWGSATKGEMVTVSFHDQIKTTIADNNGQWQVKLDDMPASGKAAVMTIAGDSSVITLKNILVGEVWLCSGQSNMQYTMMKETKYVNAQRSKGMDSFALKKENDPEIRLFLVNRDLTKPGDINKGWHSAEGVYLRSFSAAGYFFAKELFDALHVPIGVISSAVPGSAIEPWMSGKASEKNGALNVDENQPGKFFKGWIKPLAPFSVKGFLWYQGETNCFMKDSLYAQKFIQLINSWRTLWNEKNAPFYFVQIAPFYYSKSKGQITLNEETLPWLRKQQEQALTLPHTAMVVTTDLADDLSDIHPSYKWEVGKRLALIALAKDYHKNFVYSGPVFENEKIEGNKIEIKFRNTGSGLVTIDHQPLNWFNIAGADKKFLPARAVIQKNKVIVSNSKIKSPVYVRFGWNEAAQPNLFNKEGLPAVPFSTYKNDLPKETGLAF
jgi:sialate O-acetylesterase